MNEQEIKEKLLEESKSYEIKTKSEDIIEAFKVKKYKKVPFYFSKVFITSVSSLALFTLIAVPTYLVIVNKNTSTPQIDNKEKVLNMMSYETLAGLSYLENNLIDSKMNKRFLNSEFDRDEFVKVCDVFYSYVPLVSNLNEFQNYVEIDSEDANYPYGVRFLGYKVFYKVIDDNRIEGKIHKEEEVLDLEVNIEREKDEVETSCVILKNPSNYIEIEKEVEGNENEYSLKHVIDSNIYEEVSFEIDDKKELEVSTYKYEELGYEYSIDEISESYIRFDAEGEEAYLDIDFYLDNNEFHITVDSEEIVYKKFK